MTGLLPTPSGSASGLPFRGTPAITDAAARAFLTLLDATLMDPAVHAPLTGSPHGAGRRRVLDAAGRTVEVPAQPRRVFAHDDFTTLPMLLALGVPVVATTSESVPARLPSFLTPLDTRDIAVVGRFAHFSVRQLAALAPDLILARPGDLDDLAPTLSRRIAPVVAPPLAEHTDDWQGNLRAVAAVVDRTERAEELLSAVDREIAAAVRRLAPVARRWPVLGLVGIDEDGVTRLSRPDRFPGTVLARLGFVHPTRRRSPLLDADVLLCFPVGSDPARHRHDLDAVTFDPVWADSVAVRAGRVHRIDPDPVAAEGGVQQVRALLAELERILAA
ncbi:ABC transporter substrate-binding protein [Pseudonocardia sp.]|uniref:ABC transporter substrate-binding protein n=1 Tax=Pseudonocardia sp. TaxID=60912 RepID=UPI003D0D5AA6